MDWHELVKDKRFQVAAAGVAGIGAFVFVRKRQAGTTTPAAPTAATTSGAVGGQFSGAYDSTGNDVASWLGQYSAGLNDQLKEWSGNLTDTLTAIQSGSTNAGSGAGNGFWSPGDWFYTSPGNQSWLDVAKVALPNGNTESWNSLAVRLAKDNAAQSAGALATRSGQVIHIGTGSERNAALNL